MRNRIFEILAALAGVAIVVAIYLYRQEVVPEDGGPVPEPVSTLPERPAPAPVPKVETPVLESAQPTVVEPTVVEPIIDEAAVASARMEWETAVADREAVEAELEVLDVHFDAKETELEEMEAQGMDPELLEEEMLIFLDGIVDEYDLVEARLAEAEAAEAAAAERLAELQGGEPQS
jgi:hypothetical protein